ncbi:Nucleoside-diphosphate-sugar epimerase [Chitinophaga costaii]|uniref:Nucleoside-diphosphate-sugar epimerase n=1 Tax=Chitinophaga costaii TaxID=1335309 RepID=A0A1C4EXX3_9BACT|nr:aldehyde reductase [Chitinophaga costaii]PUZ21563.1 aldehyde reductase [Chitinophaga costaii]SCC48414.1 Nucleoside-diphosphate-sugar epimerase [Chitinophaga costaii]
MENKEIVLVTGGTGFVAMRILLQLLQKGYYVRTTVRSLKSKDKIISALTANGVHSVEPLSFVETELTKDDHWEEAMKDCKYVLSVASPLFFEHPENEQEAIRPAVEGILRILKFAKQAGVQRVVMTSNFGAVGFSQTDKSRATTEEDWTDTNLKGLSIYEKSKTLAERAAWNFIKREGGDLEFATVNAVAIFGPSLDAHISGSLNLLKHLLDGTMKRVPPIPLNLVDVRDVADLHLRAMVNPKAKGQRFIATADGQISLPEIARYLRKKRPEIAAKVSTKTIPPFVVKFLSLFIKRAKEGAVFLRMNRHVSNEKARKILGWTPIVPTNEIIILDSVDSMKKFNVI